MCYSDDQTHDLSGNRYINLDEFKRLDEGDQVKLDNGFTCLNEGFHTLHKNGKCLMIYCDEGEHDLTSQCQGNGFLVGVYPT